jgi:large subunit ribosomal protein L31e
MAEEIERIYIIPLKKVGFNNAKAAPTAIKRVKSYLTKHMHVKLDDIWIDDSLNNAIWAQGKYKIPSKIRVKAVKFDDGVVEAYLPELEFKKSRRELLKEEREKKEPILRKEEAVEEGEEGGEDYDIAPAADGDVKIKKKKAPKKKSEEDKETKEKKPAKKKEKPKEAKEEKKKPAEKKSTDKKVTKKPATKKTAKKKTTTSKSKPKKKSE